MSDSESANSDVPEEMENGNQNSDVEMEENDKTGVSGTENKLVKRKKHGIIYISSIPKYMTVSILRELLGEYAKIGRVFLQPAKDHNQNDSQDGETKKKKRKKKYRQFTEGWVEILSKRAAKLIAFRLNAKPISTRKKSKFCDILWNMKYLPRFKWIHLSERLTYEKMVYKQRLQNEISQARKEANYFGANLDKSERIKKKLKKEKNNQAEQ